MRIIVFAAPEIGAFFLSCFFAAFFDIFMVLIMSVAEMSLWLNMQFLQSLL